MPENLNLSIESINVHADSGNANHFCEIFKVYPEAKEKFGGYLFGLIEIAATPHFEAEKIYQIILTTLKENYYQQVSNSPDPTKLNIEAIFEFSLNKVNQRLIELIEIGQITLIIENLHYFVGVIKSDLLTKGCFLIFANRGNVFAHLIHQPPQKQPQILNIIAGNNSSTSPNDKAKFFSSIANGILPQDDTLIVSTEIFQNLISPTKILNIFSNNTFVQAIDYFKMITKKVRNDSPLTYGLLAFKYAISPLDANQPISQQSINEFINITEKTKKLLTPSFTLNIKQNLKKIIKIFTQIFSSKKSSTNTISIKGVFSNILSLPKKIFASISPSTTIEPPKNSNPNLIKKITRLFDFRGKKNIILFSSIILLVILTLGSIYFANQRSIAKENERVYAAQINKVKILLNEAESSYIYRDTDKSVIKLQEATKELSYLPQSTDTQQINYRDLDKQINDLRNKILNIEKIVPQFVTDLIIDGQPLNHSLFSFIEDKIYTFGSNNIITEIDPEQKSIGKLYNTDNNIVRGVGNNENKLFIDNNNILYQISNQTITKYNGNLTEHKNASFYNGNLYLLSNIAQQIIKYQPTSMSTGEPQNWISNLGTANLTTAESLAIDGSIYTINSNGEINRFYAGQNETFNNPAIEPLITEAKKIITDLNTDNLYIFEPKTKRLIIIKKNGQLAKQIVFDSLTKTEDLVMSADFSNGYILSENKIYKFSL